MPSLHLLLATGFLAWACRKILIYVRAMRSINNHPGPRMMLSVTSILGGAILPYIPGVAAGRNPFFRNKHKLYSKYGWDGYAEIAWLGSPTVTIALADAEAIKEVSNLRNLFPKPIELYESLAIFGDNIVNTNGEEWRKYKKLTAPAFSDRNNRLVCTETVRVVTELFEDVWRDQESIEMDHCLNLTLPIALFVLGAAVFGNRVSWEDGDAVPVGHKLTFKEAINTAISQLLIKAALPEWTLGLTESTRRMRLSFEELRSYLNEMLQEGRARERENRNDLFSLLLSPSTGDAGSGERLEDIEILGNTFIFLVAGHETTAHSLCFAFGLLALYQEEQEKLYQHICSVLPNGQNPTFDDLPRLTYSLAVFHETLRLFPAVIAIPRVAAEDTTLVVGNQKGEKTTVTVPRGTSITVDGVGLHYNPRYWPDPHSFKPERFLDPNWPRDAFISFSTGSRACLGRKFSETEAIIVITMIISGYKVVVREEAQFASETFEERKERVLANKARISLTPTRVPVTFLRRR